MNKPRWDIYENNKKTVLAEKENFTEFKNTYTPQTEQAKNLNFSQNLFPTEDKNTQNFQRRKRLNNEISKNSENEKRNFPLINLTKEENENFTNYQNFQNEENLFDNKFEKKIKFTSLPNGSEKKYAKNPTDFFTEKESKF